MNRRYHHTGPAGHYFEQQSRAAQALTYTLSRLQREIREQNKDVQITEIHDDLSFHGGDAMWAMGRYTQIFNEFTSGGSNA